MAKEHMQSPTYYKIEDAPWSRANVLVGEYLVFRSELRQCDQLHMYTLATAQGVIYEHPLPQSCPLSGEHDNTALFPNSSSQPDFT
jgi:hypothetical protein